jgi:hypothetical protein
MQQRFDHDPECLKKQDQTERHGNGGTGSELAQGQADCQDGKAQEQ